MCKDKICFPDLKYSFKDNGMFKAKIITIYYGVFYTRRSKVYGSKCIKDPKGEVEAYYCKVLRLHYKVYHELKVDCDIRDAYCELYTSTKK